jgi:hypothetical protein
MDWPYKTSSLGVRIRNISDTECWVF